MKPKLCHALGFIGLLILGFASTTNAQTTANGPYYAPPAWDQTLPVSTRFIILSNFNSEAVLDRETGLVWQRTPGVGAPTSFFGARANCMAATTGNRIGWRLPSIHELHSLFDPTVTGVNAVALPAGHPFIFTAGIPSSFFWTGTSLSENQSFAFTTRIIPGPFGSFEKTDSARFWCVRGGGPIGVY